MKYDITKRQLSKETKQLIRKQVGKRGNADQLIEEVEKVLKEKRPRKEWDQKVLTRQRAKTQARSFLTTIEGMRSELKHLVNQHISRAILSANFNQLLDRDWIGILQVGLRAHVYGSAEQRVYIGHGVFENIKASYEYSKSDSPSLNIVDQLAEAWKKHTRLSVSYADGCPFVEFVTMVLNATGKNQITDPRRIIKLMLKHSPNLKGKK